MKRILILAFVLGFIFPSCKSVYRINNSQTSYNRIDKKLDNSSDAKIDSIIAPYKETLDKQMNQVIGYSDGLSKQKIESTMGNWVADVIAEQSSKLLNEKIDFGTQNYGGLRIKEIPKGPITIGKIFELMPFENFLVILKVKGNIVQEFLDRTAVYGGWPISKSVKFTIEGDKAVNVLIDGKPIDADKIYNIAIPDYVANGGDKCTFFKEQPRVTTGTLIRDILIKDVKEKNAKGENIYAEIEGRVEEKK